MSRSIALALTLGLALSGLACAEGEEPATDEAADTFAADAAATDTVEASARRDTLSATLHDPAGAEVGSATLIGTPNGVLVTAELDGLPPGEHAFHLHETGACEPDFGAAGGHLNPGGAAHGILDPDGPHVGDMPNVHVPASGALTVEVFATNATIEALTDGDGSAVVLHAGADDYATDPAGAAGDRIACGVIETGAAATSAAPDTSGAAAPAGP